MQSLKALAYFRLHPFLGIVIVAVAGIFGLAILLYTAPTAYGIPFGGQVTFYVPSCAPYIPPPGSGTCPACPVCGALGPTCASVGEMMVNGQSYCPMVGFPFLGGAIPRIGGYVLGFGTPMVPVNSIMAPTGVSL